MSDPRADITAAAADRPLPFTLDRRANDTSLALDLLRALAAQFVCVGHACNLFLGPGTTYLPHVGVLLFFVLSGFVIAHTLQMHSERPGYGLAAFVVDRGARIFTAYWPALLLIAGLDAGLAALGHAPDPAASTWAVWWRNALMLQNYVGHWVDGVPTYGSAGQLGSVAVEWHIYVFVGALWFLLRGCGRRACLPVAVLAAAQPLGYFSPLPDSDRALFVLWLLGFGAWFVARATHLDRRMSRLALAALPVLVVLWLRQRVPGAEYGIDHYPLLALVLLALVLGTQHGRMLAGHAVLRRLVPAVAGYAYSLFLVHYTLQKLLLALWPQGGVGAVLLAALVGNFVAWGFARLTEARYRRVGACLRRHLLRLPEPSDPPRATNAR